MRIITLHRIRALCIILYMYTLQEDLNMYMEWVHFLFPNNKMMIMTRFDTVPSIADGVQHDLRSSS